MKPLQGVLSEVEGLTFSSEVEKYCNPQKSAINYGMLYINQPQEMYYVYILKCSNRAYYVGLTNNLLLRFQEHLDGVYPNCYTYDKRPLTLLYYETIPFHKEAMEREKQLKGWSRSKKEALIARDYHKLQLLAECQNLSHRKYKDLK